MVPSREIGDDRTEVGGGGVAACFSFQGGGEEGVVAGGKAAILEKNKFSPCPASVEFHLR